MRPQNPRYAPPYELRSAAIARDRSTEARRLNVRHYATAFLFTPLFGNARPVIVLWDGPLQPIGRGVHTS